MVMIANTYGGVSWQNVRNHKEHLSRQLVQAYEKKSRAWAMELLDHLRDIVFKAAAIFDRSYAKNTTTGDAVALNALKEQRGTFELLAKVVAYSQAKAVEEQQADQVERVDLSDFSTAELQVALKLGLKMNGNVVDLLAPSGEGVHCEALEEPPIPIPRAAPPLKTPPQLNLSPDNGDVLEEPGDSQGEPEIQRPPGLPPRPYQTIPGGSNARIRINRHILGRKINEGQRER